MQWILNALIVLLLLVALLHLYLFLRMQRRRGAVAPPLHEVLPEGVVPLPRMMLYFYSEHCGVCRHVTPLVEQLGRERDGVVKVDVRRHIGTARRFGITMVPSLVVVDNGRIDRVHVGKIGDNRLQEFFDGRAD